ncbi:MAG: lytic transglycosylase domain-containing protein [Acetobacteraceae bacterium]|nr:lytic transglycosylase domain-containing protein [Acetobacteraceae bacterium]
MPPLTAHAAFSLPPLAPSCIQAVAAAEQTNAIPAGLLSAIARVESGRRDPDTGSVIPWPWTVNADGQGQFFATKAQAIQSVRASSAYDIDVGCMQISLLHHPHAFQSLDQAFDPTTNAQYAATYLRQLYQQTNDWTQAAALYHSATPALAADYRQKVLAAWDHQPTSSPLARAWAATLTRPFGTSGLGMAVPVHIFASAPSGQPGASRGLAAYRNAPIAITSLRRPG